MYSSSKSSRLRLIEGRYQDEYIIPQLGHFISISSIGEVMLPSHWHRERSYWINLQTRDISNSEVITSDTMVYWIASGNRTNWEVVKKYHIWGVPKRSKSLHSRVKIGDTLLMYSRSETHGKEVYPSVIMGEFLVTEMFTEDTPLFTPPPQMGDELFPYRFRLKPVAIFQKAVELKPLIPELGFVSNKKMWSGHFRQAMREIPEEDYKKIVAVGTAKK